VGLVGGGHLHLQRRSRFSSTVPFGMRFSNSMKFISTSYWGKESIASSAVFQIFFGSGLREMEAVKRVIDIKDLATGQWE